MSKGKHTQAILSVYYFCESTNWKYIYILTQTHRTAAQQFWTHLSNQVSHDTIHKIITHYKPVDPNKVEKAKYVIK